MKRRDFLRMVIGGLIAAPVVAKVVVAEPREFPMGDNDVWADAMRHYSEITQAEMRRSIIEMRKQPSVLRGYNAKYYGKQHGLEIPYTR